MDFFLSFVAWLFLLIASLYAWSAYERRKEMLPRVLAFLSRNDACPQQQEFARYAFEDTLTILWPLYLVKTSLLIADRDPDITKVTKELDELRDSNPEADCELDEIYSMMLRLNFRFNFITHAIAFLCFKCSSRFRGQKMQNVLSRAYVERTHC